MGSVGNIVEICALTREKGEEMIKRDDKSDVHVSS